VSDSFLTLRLLLFAPLRSLSYNIFAFQHQPGNILVDFPTEAGKKAKIGLIDYGQCKQLTPNERVKIARLIISIAEKESDEDIANKFRSLGIKTKNDSTRFLAEFGRLMFGAFESKHLDHSWHKDLHNEDRVLYFPRELSMVYRTALLLRGLAMSLQYNPSVGELWKHHALEAIIQHGS
jgi:aarF domain-containing kinase